MVGRSHDRRGFALVVVLWVLVLAGAVAATLYEIGRGERLAAANARASAATRWAARGAIALALDSLDRFLHDPRGEGSWPATGDTLLSPFDFAGGDAVARAVIRDARARINVNVADSATLFRLLSGLEVSPFEAAALTSRILDWRDADQDSRAQGAEASDYPNREAVYGPGDAPFRDPTELRGVLGMPATLFRQLRPLVTTYGDGRVNVNTAPAIVLQAALGLDPETAQAIVLRRARRPFRAFGDFDRLIAFAAVEKDSIAARVSFFPRHLEIEAEGAARGRRSGVRPVALIELLGGPAWRLDEIGVSW